MRSTFLLISLLTLPLACTPSQSPPSEPGAPSPAEHGTAQPTPSEEPQQPSSASPEPAAEPASGSLHLPASTASAWNTGQSDGQPGKADRGIADYQKIIQNDREKFRSCYDAALAKRKDIKGRVTLVWVLDPAGAVRTADDHKPHIDPNASAFYDEFLEACMVGAVKTLTFPPSRRGMDSTVRYPFDFQPQGRPPSR